MLGGHEFKSKEEGKPLETEISFHWLTSRASRPFSNKRKLRVLCVHWELLEMGHYFEVLQGNDPWIMMILLISYSSNYINYCVKIEFTKYRLEECLLLKNEGVTMQRHFLSFTGSFENTIIFSKTLLPLSIGSVHLHLAWFGSLFCITIEQLISLL